MTEYARRWLQGLPERFRTTVEGVTRDMLNAHPDILAMMVVGSLAEGEYDEHSDVDVLYVREPMIPTDEIVEIRKPWPLVHFIYHSRASLKRHFSTSNTMAWSIKRGIVLRDPQRVLTPFRARTLDAPSKEWIRSHAQEVAEWSNDKDGLRKKMINFGILYLELMGIVPTTKRQLGKHFLEQVPDDILLAGMRIAIERGRSPEDYSADEARTLKAATELLLTRIGQAREDHEPTHTDNSCQDGK